MLSPDSLEAAGEHFDGEQFSRLKQQKGSMLPFVTVLTLQIFDFVASIVTGYIWYRIYCSSFDRAFGTIYGKFTIVAAVLAALIFQLAGCYRTDQLLDRGRTIRALLVGFAWLLTLGLMTAFLCKSLNHVSRVWTVLWLVSWAVASLVVRIYAIHALRLRAAAGNLAETIALVGATDWAVNLYAQLLEQKGSALRVVGIFDDRRERIAARFNGSVRTVDDLLKLGKRVNIDRVVLTLPLNAETRILEISNRLMALSVDIVVCPDVTRFNLLRRAVLSQAGFPAIRISARPISGEQFFVKVAEDKIIGLILLLLSLPAILVIAIAIKLTSPGPVLFRQLRHGYNNREFEVLKFRTMRFDLSDTAGTRQAQRHDGRVTKLGRFLRRTSLDELPQLINVLRGDMSMVGPRPLPIGMRTQDLYNHQVVENYAHRHRVRPGITGWAQVNGHRGATDHPIQLRKRVELDLFYIENWSLAFDLKILLLTGAHLIHSNNAF